MVGPCLPGTQSPVGGEPQPHGVAGAFMVTVDAASSLPHPSSPPQRSPAGQSNGLLVPSMLGLFLAMGANTPPALDGDNS